MIKTRKWAVLATAGAFVVVAALATVLVLPQAAMAAPVSATAAHRGMPFDGPMMGQQSGSGLADALGITEEALQEAQEAAHGAAIDQALEQGLITQAQADALKENQRFGFGGRGMSGFFGMSADIDHEALLAEALGISVTELQAAQEAAADARIAQAVADGKLTEEQAGLMKARQALQQYLEDEGFFTKAVEQAVEAGIITQAQADSILSQQTPGMWGAGKGGMRGPGGFSGFGGRGGRR